MQITLPFSPRYIITNKIMTDLLRIERAKEQVAHMPLTPAIIRSLRESARLCTTHYSTMIEGNGLSLDQVAAVVKHKGHFPGRERDEHEVLGYYAALAQVTSWGMQRVKITGEIVQTIHALVMAGGKVRVRPTPYRDGQNVIRDGRSGAIVYLPPEARDVDDLMSALIDWVGKNREMPVPLVAAIAHYQFATIHPYFDGNGRTARLLTTLILHCGGYDVQGLYALEEYYARNLLAYYEAISVGDSHNYYMGRADADITRWIEYFIDGVAVSFEKIAHHARAVGFGMDERECRGLLRKLDAKQQKALELFFAHETVTSGEVAELFGMRPRTGATLCAQWAKQGFLVVADPSNRGRKYRLADEYAKLIGQ